MSCIKNRLLDGHWEISLATNRLSCMYLTNATSGELSGVDQVGTPAVTSSVVTMATADQYGITSTILHLSPCADSEKY
jgi:hypothetical protein